LTTLVLLLVLLLLWIPHKSLGGTGEKKLDITKLKESTGEKDTPVESILPDKQVKEKVEKEGAGTGEKVDDKKVMPVGVVENKNPDDKTWWEKEEKNAKKKVRGREVDLAYLMRVAFSLIAICIVVYLFLRFFGKYISGGVAFGKNKTMIKILEKQTVGPNRQFCVVEVPGKTVLVGMTENEMNVLCEIDNKAVEEFYEDTDEDKREVGESKPSTVNYLTDVFLRRFQGGK